MTKAPWLPIGFALPGGQSLSSIFDSGPDWTIVGTDQRQRVLVVRPALLERWVRSQLLDENHAQRFEFGSERFAAIASGPCHMLAALANSPSPSTKGEAMAFAAAMRETRTLDSETSLHDGLFLEKLSRVLPTYTDEAKVTDDVVLGSWLSGGLQLSVFPLRRMQKILSWLDTEHLKDLVECAGFEVKELVSGEGPETKDTRVSRGPNKRPATGGTVSAEPQFQLPGRKALETFFNERVLDIVKNPSRYKSLGIEFPPAIVLEGPPGCGKTFAVDRLVEFLGWPLYSIESASVASPYIHETSRKVASVFEQAIENAPSVIVIDEMEAFLADRGASIGSGHHRVEEVAEFLRRIPKAVTKGVLIIGMTNRLDMIDNAILRRGRFDQIIRVDYAEEEEVRALLSSLLADVPKADNVDIAPLARALAGRPLSDVTYVVREGAWLAARAGYSCIDNDSLVAALASAPARDPGASPRRIGFT
jgi:cell division protease FtsH